MHAGGGTPGGSWAEPQVLRMCSKGTCQPTRCQSAKSSMTGTVGTFLRVRKQGTVEIDMDGEYQGVCKGAVGLEERRVQKDMMRETLEELLRESPALKRIVACSTTPEETRTVVSGPSGEDTVSEGADL